MIAFAALLLAAPADAASGQEDIWETRKKQGGDIVLSDVVVDPSEPRRWFALHAGNLYVSYAGGNGWRAIAFDVDGVKGDGSVDTHGLAFDPASPGVLFAHFGGKTRRSVDGGTTWADDPARIEWVDGRWTVLRGVTWKPPQPARAYARDPSNADIVYAATEKGVYASADAGRTWEARTAWLKDTNVVDLRVDPENTQSLVALSASNAYRSTNGGRMWTELSPDAVHGGPFRRIVHDDGERLVATFGSTSLYVQSGSKWTRDEVRCAAVSVLSGGEGLCANPGTLARGELASRMFETRLRTNFQKAHVLRLRETLKGNVVATLDGGGALWSSDGRAWSVYYGLDDGYVRDVAEDPSGSGVVFRAGGGAHIWKSAAEGWISRPADSSASVVRFDPASPMRLYLASRTGKMWRSDDLGWTFTAATGLPGSGIEDMAVDPAGTGVLWAATWGDGLYRSPDGGKTWAAAGQGAGATYVRRIALDPASPDTVWAAALASGLWRTTDGGTSWQPVQTGCKVVHAVAVHPLQAEKVAVGCEDGKVVRTQDGGTTWGAPTLVSKADVGAVLFTSGEPKLVAGTAAAEVIWVGDGGDVVKNDRFANMRVELVSFMPSGDRGVIHGKEGMFLTTDGGKSWAPVGMTDKRISSVLIAPDGIWAWARGEGLYAYQDERKRWERRPTPSVQCRGIGKDDVPCDAPIPVEAAVTIHAGDHGLLLVEPDGEGVREWYGANRNWDIYGRITCTSRTGVQPAHSLNLPGNRIGEWVGASRAAGLVLPPKLEKAIEGRNLDVRENILLEDGTTFFITRAGSTGLWDGETFERIGALPEGAVSYRMAWQTGTGESSLSMSKPRTVLIYVGTEHGVVMSTDLGKSFRKL